MASPRLFSTVCACSGTREMKFYLVVFLEYSKYALITFICSLFQTNSCFIVSSHHYHRSSTRGLGFMCYEQPSHKPEQSRRSIVTLTSAIESCKLFCGVERRILPIKDERCGLADLIHMVDFRSFVCILFAPSNSFVYDRS
jgi:hypothetical protein